MRGAQAVARATLVVAGVAGCHAPLATTKPASVQQACQGHGSSAYQGPVTRVVPVGGFSTALAFGSSGTVLYSVEYYDEVVRMWDVESR